MRWAAPSGPTGVIGGAGTWPHFQRVLHYGNAAPVSGTFQAGDLIFNRSPVAGGTAGWICVAGGSPGSWKTFGPISA